MLRVMSKRQKMIVVGTCPHDNLSCSRNLKNYYFFSHQTRTFRAGQDGASERLRTIAPSRLEIPSVLNMFVLSALLPCGAKMSDRGIARSIQVHLNSLS